MFSNYSRVLRPSNRRGRVREYTIGAQYEATGNDRFTRSLTRIGGVNYGMLFADGAELRAWGNSTYEQLDTLFGIGPTLTVAPGAYQYEDVGIRYESNQSAALSGGIEVKGGEFWTGRQRTATGNLRYRFSAHVAASATLARSTVDLPDGPGDQISRIREHRWSSSWGPRKAFFNTLERF